MAKKNESGYENPNDNSLENQGQNETVPAIRETVEKEKVKVSAVAPPVSVSATPVPKKAQPKLSANILGADNSGNADKPKSFFDEIYDQIEKVLGGNNPNQFLCLTIPGQALTAEDFAYDYKNNEPKGPTVEANESRLANKLFAPCHVTGADNGLTLPYQYKSALDTLTPKLNAKIAKAKNELRELLLTTYPYDFGDGSNKTYTLQEVFYRLFDDYVAAEQAWSEKQNVTKENLRKKYPDTDAASNVKYNDAYLEWYETVAQSELAALNEKRGKVLSVFSPNDMDILAGILDSGSGAELEQAREILQNTQKLTPDGGYVYPVKFNPTSWFELLNSSFTPVDLLKTPAALAMQLQSLSSRRISLNARIREISEMIPDATTLKDLQEKVKTAQDSRDDAQQKLIETYGDGIKTVVSAGLDVASFFANGAPTDVLKKLAGGVTLPDGKTPADLVSDLTAAIANGTQAQSNLVSAGRELSTAMMSAIAAQNLSMLSSLMSPMKEQLDQINAQIDDIKAQMQVAVAVRPAPDTKTETVTDSNTSVNDVAPPEVPAGYTQILIEASAASMNTQTSKQASASASTSGVSFWFGGYSSSSDSSSSSYASSTNDKETNIQIGMNVAKVGIERSWFNPGVFVLSKDMFNVSTSRVSPGKEFTEVSPERLKEMNKDYILPCYPTALIIARDISIKITSKDSLNSSFADSVESHASHGGGFLFFSGSSSSSSSSSESGAHTSSTDNSVTIKFSTPQIIGYYLQATPPDYSVELDNVSGDSIAGFVTISQFVADYKAMLAKMNHKTDIPD